MFSFTTNPVITINFTGQDSRMKKKIRVQGGDPIELPVYNGQENVAGTVEIAIPPGKKVEHQGIRIEMIGQTGKQSIVVSCVKFLLLIK
jgi:vacuolar protein sorting-associated protein 26